MNQWTVPVQKYSCKRATFLENDEVQTGKLKTGKSPLDLQSRTGNRRSKTDLPVSNFPVIVS